MTESYSRIKQLFPYGPLFTLEPYAQAQRGSGTCQRHEEVTGHSWGWGRAPSPVLSCGLVRPSPTSSSLSPSGQVTSPPPPHPHLCNPPHPRQQGPTPALSHLPRDFPPLLSAPLLGLSLCWPTSQQVDTLKSFLCTKLHTHPNKSHSSTLMPSSSHWFLVTSFSFHSQPSF